MTRLLIIGVLLLLPVVPVQAQINEPTPIKLQGEQLLSYREAQAMSLDTFLNSHLDIKYLVRGRKAYLAGNYKEAIPALERSSRYGEKLAQAMLAEMYWNGEGVPVNKARAYAMADVAAERMNQPFLISKREEYWAAMTPAEQQQAIAMSEEILGLYADKVTMPKMAQVLRNSKGSRHRAKGYGRLLTYVIAYNGDGTIEEDIWPSAFFAQKFWEPKEYQKFKDKYVAAAVRYGNVTVRMGDKVQTSRQQGDNVAPVKQPENNGE